MGLKATIKRVRNHKTITPALARRLTKKLGWLVDLTHDVNVILSKPIKQ